jgi:heme/copper-type cytochrome/quinol oxidase subunit 3
VNVASSDSIVALGWDDRRGTGGMVLFIATEAALFVVLFFAYFYLAHGHEHWVSAPPKVGPALIMLAVFILSSIVLFWGERRLRRGNERAARTSLYITILLGVGFIILQMFEYRDRLREIKPTSDAYGSMFYTITSIHGAHVVLGLLMLGYVALLPRLEPAPIPPHRPMYNVALYWHFVHAVWIVIVLALYVLPNVGTR